MRVALWSYPMLLQRRGGLQVQFLETLVALKRLGVDAALLDWRSDKLADFDLIHVFAAKQGNYQVVEAAQGAGVPAVVSSVLHPPFTAWDRRVAVICESIVGRVTGWRERTSYRETRACLSGSSHIVANSEREKHMLLEGYRIDLNRISVIPNGVDARFFEADPGSFVSRFGIKEPFVLCVGSVSPYKNQLTLVRALKSLPIEVVLIGDCDVTNRTYLDRCLRIGRDRVHYLGGFDHNDPLIASAYSAAAVFVLPSKSEVMPLSVFEALAAGTPVVLTKNHNMDFSPRRGVFMEVNHLDEDAIAASVEACLSAEAPIDFCAAMVRRYSWDEVANNLLEVYRSVISARSSRACEHGPALSY